MYTILHYLTTVSALRKYTGGVRFLGRSKNLFRARKLKTNRFLYTCTRVLILKIYGKKSKNTSLMSKIYEFIQ